ncbi:inositol monophosphatase family protein [Nocardioides donggukensis]|uniref:Inositol monophosphatase n=1 Tax=Nocardioides donggukensis TaxID=2774019 RepID=A0A927K8N5_9ACTN|nr:inositol monophosphatase [Nocardioides donggukensis]MBD8869786.1 inositol monophosphatase [Nocardioides donggukensis]
MSDLRADADLAAGVVREAGELALAMRAEGLEAEQKTSVSDLVTAADRAAEALVVERLRAARPHDAIVGEEGAAHSGTSGRTWVIDPVDGTYNFVAGMSWWCCAIALTGPDDVLLGAVHHPAERTTYVGGPGLPTTRDGRPVPRLEDRSLATSSAATYLHPPFHGTVVGDAWRRAASGAATLRMLGSGSLDATAVAQGRFGVLFQHTVPDHDRLPGAGLIRGAGGTTRQVTAGGVVWSVAGAPTAVAEVCAALTGR